MTWKNFTTYSNIKNEENKVVYKDQTGEEQYYINILKKTKNRVVLPLL